MTKPLSPSNLDGELQSDTSHVQNLLRDITADVLRIDHEDLDLDRSFLSLGGDSITAIKMMARGKAKGITLNVVDMIDTKSIRELCERACRQSPGLIANTEEIKVSEKPEESHNLSLLQKLYAETGNTEARIFSLSRGTSYNSLHGALSSLVERHPMLRAKLGRTKNGDWELQASDYTAKSFILELHAVDTEEELIGTVSKIRARLSRSHAPAFAAIVFEMTSGPRMLALAAHGAIMDTTAWQIFAKKLASQLGHDETLALHSRYFHEWPLEAIQGNGHRLSTSVQYFEKQFGIDQHDLTGSTPSKPFSESERWDVKRLVIEEHQTRLLLDQPIQSRRVVSTAADIIHSALVVAASTTTPLDEEDILFCNLNEDRSQIQLDNSLNNIGCFDVISQSHMRFSPFKDDIRRIARFNGPNLSSLIPFEDRTELQRASRQSTPPPESATTTIVVDSRRLNDNTRGAEKLVPQGESNLWFSSVHNSGSPHLSVSLVSTGKTISCSFRGNPKWHETYGLEDFVSVFKAALSGTLSRLRQTQSNAIEKIPHPAAENPARDDNLPLKQIVNSGNSAVRSIWPCSPVQEGFLISQSTNQELYQCCFVLKFVAHSMSAQRLASSWQEVVKRHAILRTMFLSSSTRPGQFDQIVLDNYFTPAIEFYDWTQQLTSQNFNSHEPVAFQPSTVPHRVHLAQASPDEVYMKLEISHALADGQSTDVIIRDLCAAYRGTQATPSVLPYGEFVEYQSQLSMEQSQAYWSKYLSNTQPTFLPMDRGHEALSDFDTLSTRLEFDENFLPEFCGRHGVTMSNVCQVAWGLVLRSFTGSSNVTFSYITSGRSAPLENLHSAVGPFVGTLICSMKFDSVTAIEDTLRRVSKDYFEAFSQPYVPDPSSSGANSKSALQLGNTTLQYQRVLDTTASTNSEIQVSVLEKSNPTDYDIAVGIEAERDALTVDLDFWRSRMSHEHAKVVSKVFCEAIRWILRNPQGTSTDINLLGVEDKTQLLGWNQELPRAMQYCLHEKIAEIALQQPEGSAVHAWDGNLTYKELITEAATLSHRLVELGVSPESMVGLCMDKSKWAIISMLAILQAGGVVVPLGNSHPLTRIDGILGDTKANLILADKQQSDRLAHLTHNPVILTVDEAFQTSLPSKFSAPQIVVTPDNTAWVIFTSGSTGTPKGVLLQHKSLSTSVKAHGEAFGITCETRAAQFAAYTFDVSISDIFATLHHGGCVCTFSEETRMNNLTASLQEFQVNYVNLTPTVMRLLDPADLPLIKTAVVGGEPLDPKLVERWAGQATVINSYGPSECSIISTCYSVSDPAEASIVGFPTATRLWVAETSNPNRLCPIGVPGELLIDGPLLSRGYLNDATKTAASFISNPLFAADLGLPSHLRFYRTGDLVRQNGNGSLTHLGRRDLQVKIRGQRVEIGEIEHWVTTLLNDTKLAAVLITNQGQQNKQIGLAAIIEFNKESIHYDSQTTDRLVPPTNSLRKTFDELRTSLFKVLPAYMVPTVYLPVSQMPLNPSGKLDRRAVKDLIESITTKDLQQYTTTTKASISTETEAELQKLWSQALGISTEDIGANDHFLQIGGDSVAAIRIVSAMRESNLRGQMTVADIFQHSRLSDLAKVLDRRTGAKGTMSEQKDAAPFDLWKKASEIQAQQVEEQLHEIAAQCAITQDQIEDVYPCTPLQEGMMAITARQPTAYMMHQVFSLADVVDADRLQAAWERMVQSSPILRTRILFRPQSTSLQVVVRKTTQWKKDSSLENYLRESRVATMEPGKPLNDFAFIEEASGKRFFVWTSHHSTYDGWSRSLILEQVANIYSNDSVPRPVPYTRFINYLSSADSETTKQYWQDQFSGNPVANFPSLPQVNYQPSPRHQIKYDISLSKRDPTEVSMPDVLRAAWALVVSQHAGNHDPVFAVALSGRDAPVLDIANLVAPTITTVPVRVHIDETQSLEKFLKVVQEQRIGMIVHQHTGLQRIRKLLPGQEAVLDLRHMLVVQPAAQSDSSSSIAGMEEVPIDMEEFDSYGLNLECSLSPTVATVDVRFDENVISKSQVERMLDQLALVTRQLCDPAKLQQRVGDIDHLNQKDLQLIKKWNQKVPPPAKSCIHQQVAKMASTQPQRAAVCAWDGNMTYAELLTQAATLSHYLLQLDPIIGPETKIGLCMDKSKWAVVAMLAILQTGAAAVPLGVSHPRTRIDQIVGDAAAPLVLVDHSQQIRLHGLAGKLVTVDATLLDSLVPQSQHPSSRVTPDNAAWIIFTSGSTGVPKGVVLEHKALATSIQAHGREFGLGPDSRVYQFAAHTFDVAIQDCFTTLVWGGTICISSEDARMNDLGAAMRSMEVTHATLTSTVARLIQPSEVPTLKTLILVGEPVQAGVVETWCKHASVLNAYGPSECSIHSTCNGPIKDPSQASNIGYAMGTRLWVAQPSNLSQLCPIGVTGELLIEGSQLARGYLNDEGKTTSSFITNPAWASNPELGLPADCRVYRTGDLVRQNEDGSLTYVSRCDTQVKLRGQRVDVGEIEFWISKKQPEARQVVVVVTKRGQDQQMLVAVIEAASDSGYNLLQPSTDALREKFDHLRASLLETLPTYMVPNIYVPVARVPTNISGKLDRRATLELVDAIETKTLLSYSAAVVKAAPSTDMERQLQMLWSQVLGTNTEVGAHDHFFQIGGDSVAAMRIVAAAREVNLRLTVADLFQYPRLSELAIFLHSRAENETIPEPQKVESEPFEMWKEAIGL